MLSGSGCVVSAVQRCCEPHPSLNCCASVSSPFISSCRRQNACVTSFSFLCALLRTAQETMIVLHTCDKKRIFQILAAFIFCLKSTFSALALELQFPTPLRVVLLCFATPSLQILLQWLRQGCVVLWLHLSYYYLLQLDFMNRLGVAA